MSEYKRFSPDDQEYKLIEDKARPLVDGLRAGGVSDLVILSILWVSLSYLKTTSTDGRIGEVLLFNFMKALEEYYGTTIHELKSWN